MLQSFVVDSLCVRKPQFPPRALRTALPCLTQLHLPDGIMDQHLHSVAQHLGGRFTFLRVFVHHVIPPPTAVLFSALQSLHIKTNTEPGPQRRAWSLHLLPRLTELAIIDGRDEEDGDMLLPLLPVGLTYLQISCKYNTVMLMPPIRYATLIPLHAGLPS